VLLPAIAITHDDLGKPSFSLDSELAAWITERGLICHLSISDETEHALAFAIVESVEKT
jgi:holo-[acyl-carrier protein] synthase